jgi:sugar O-acyltransferase (sialic acid O-acetyltransferase NeuD family)
MARPLVVVGAGGFGRESLDVAQAMENAEPGTWEILGVLDDQPSPVNQKRLQARGIPVLGPLEWFEKRGTNARVAVAVGQPKHRKSVARRLEQWGVTLATLIHPSAAIGSSSHIGEGSVVCAQASVGTNVRLGRMVHLNPHAVIGHDTHLQDFVSVNPNATISGDCTVEACVLVGAGAVVLQGLTIGAGAVVGAAACVTGAVNRGSLVIGVPAKDSESVGMLRG